MIKLDNTLKFSTLRTSIQRSLSSVKFNEQTVTRLCFAGIVLNMIEHDNAGREADLIKEIERIANELGLINTDKNGNNDRLTSMLNSFNWREQIF